MSLPAIEAVSAQCTALPGTTVDNTFGDDTDVYRVANKMFALVNVESGTVTLKVPPEEGIALRAQHACVTPGYYMNKRHWVTIDLNSGFPHDELAELVAGSRDLVIASLTKAHRPPTG